MAFVHVLCIRCEYFIGSFNSFKIYFLNGSLLSTMFASMPVAVIPSSAGIEGTVLVAIGAILVGTLMVVMPGLGQKYHWCAMRWHQPAIGHFSTLASCPVSLVEALQTRLKQRKVHS
ncbi:hypothetical protein O9993_06580 [Vibrio lentus]|nr:hypothetical protein [Vibrio lentus]